MLGPELRNTLVRASPPVPSAGLRDLFTVAPVFRALADHDAIRAIVRAALGAPGFVTRAILFDKSPGANWALGFHQDTVIAVRDRADAEGFGPWSVKAGLWHVRATVGVLDRMITVRVHLDDCPADNGPLTVIPGSHAHGLLRDSDIAVRAERGPHADCLASAGDAVLMRPLLLHASRRSECPRSRRVVHLEFACDALPAPLRWRDG